MRILLPATLLLTCSAIAQGQSELPEPLRLAIAQNDDVPSFTFDVERTNLDIGEDTESRTGYARVDLSADEFKQITPAHLIDNARPGSSFQALADIERSIEDGIWCSSLIDTPPDAEDVEILTEDTTSITYQFRPARTEDADGPTKKMRKNSRVTVQVSRDNPAILSYRRILTKPVTLYVVAKIRKVDSSATCARGPNGNTYIQSSSNEFEASGVGNSGGNNSEMRITAIYDRNTGAQLAMN